MARVPIARGNSVGNRVGPATPIATLDVTEGGRAIAEGLTGVGDALQNSADIDEQIDRDRDEAAVKKLDVEYSEWSRERLFTGEDAFYRKEGFAAEEARDGLSAGGEPPAMEAGSRWRRCRTSSPRRCPRVA